MTGPSSKLSLAAFLAGYDVDLALHDALNDPGLDPVRRTLAGLLIGVGVEHGFYMARELRQFAERLAADRARGVPDHESDAAARLHRELGHPENDQHARIWAAVSRCPLPDAITHLRWLEELLRGRASMGGVLRRAGPKLRSSAEPANSARLRMEGPAPVPPYRRRFDEPA